MKKINFSKDKESRQKIAASVVNQVETELVAPVVTEEAKEVSYEDDKETKANQEVKPHKKTKKADKREASGNKEAETV